MPDISFHMCTSMSDFLKGSNLPSSSFLILFMYGWRRREKDTALDQTLCILHASKATRSIQDSHGMDGMWIGVM